MATPTKTIQNGTDQKDTILVFALICAGVSGRKVPNISSLLIILACYYGGGCIGAKVGKTSDSSSLTPFFFELPTKNPKFLGLAAGDCEQEACAFGYAFSYVFTHCGVAHGTLLARVIRVFVLIVKGMYRTLLATCGSTDFEYFFILILGESFPRSHTLQATCGTLHFTPFELRKLIAAALLGAAARLIFLLLSYPVVFLPEKFVGVAVPVPALPVVVRARASGPVPAYPSRCPFRPRFLCLASFR